VGANTQNHRTLNPLKLIAKGDYVAVLPVLGSWQQTDSEQTAEK